MKEGIGKIKDLRDSLLDLEGFSESEIEILGRRHFSDLFLTNAIRGIHKLHDGEDVVFYKKTFDHAFFLSPKKEVIEKARVARIRWILPLISGIVPTSECLHVSRDYRPDSRLYVGFEQLYVVWLEPRDFGGWRYSTSYKTDRDSLTRYLRSGKRIWRYPKENALD